MMRMRPQRLALPAGMLLTMLPWGCNVDSSLQGVDLGQSRVQVSTSNVAVGTGSAAVSVHLARGDGSPMQGIPVSLQAEFCRVSRAPNATDANGDTDGEVACDGPLQETLQASLRYQGFAVPVPQTTSVNFYTPSDGNRGVAPGQALNVQAAAVDARGRPDASYTGTVTIASTDPNAVLPPDYTFTAADQGYKVWQQQASLKTRGVQTITVRDANTQQVLGTETFVVTQDARSAPAFVGSLAAVVGVPLSFEVDAMFANGVIDPNYTSTVTFAASDLNATLPPDYTYSAQDRGVHTFGGAVVFTRSGAQTLLVQDRISKAVSTVQLDVRAADLAGFRVEAPLTTPAGAAVTLQVLAVDRFGNPVASADPGALVVAASDANATLPSATQYVAGGTSITGTTLLTAGLVTLTVRAQTMPSLVGNFTTVVTPGPATQLAFSCDANTQAGNLLSLSVSLSDVYGNAATGYRGTVGFTGSDANGVYPGTYTFVSTDNGSIHLANAASLRTSGLQTVRVTDIADANMHGQQAVQVATAPLTAIYIDIASHLTAGASTSLTLTAGDRYRNAIIGYTGNVQLTSTDGRAALPGPVSLTSANAGTITLPASVNFLTAGTQTLSALDGNGWAGNANTQVTAAAPASVSVTNAPANTVISQPLSPNLQILDAYNNVAVQYTGTMHLSVSPNTAQYSASVTFGAGDAGQKALPYNWVFNSGGNYTIAITDGNLAVQQNISVAHGCRTYDPGVLPGVWACCDVLHMSLDHNDNPVVAWTWDSGHGLLNSTARWTPHGWPFLPSIGQTIFNPHTAINSQNQVVLAYSPGSTFGLSQTYMATDGPSGWVGTGTSMSAGFYTSSALLDGDQVYDVIMDHRDAPWLVAQQWNNDHHDIVLNAWNGSTYITVGPGGLVSTMGDNLEPVVRLDAHDVPTVAWQSDGPGNVDILVAVADANLTTWTGPAGAAFWDNISNDGGGSRHPSMVLDATGAPMVAWDDDTSGHAQIYLRYLVGGVWTELGGSATGGGISQTTGDAKFPSLALDSTGTPVVAWFDSSCASPPCLYLRRWSGASWDEMYGSATDPGLGDWGDGNIPPDLHIDHQDFPVVNFSQSQRLRTCNWR